MNHLMKGYMDTTTSLSVFIQAFKTALDSHKEYIELEIYRQDNNNITFQTTSPYEKQAAHFLTRYTLRKTQEQLIQSLNYKYETTDKSLPRSVTYCSSSESFECSCEYTQFSGFICCHIFHTAIQLNLEELLTSLFYLRWHKNISELKLAQWYHEFYSTTTLEIKTIELNQQPSDDNRINNPLIAKTKGAPKKRKTSDVEKQVSKKSKPINKQERITINKENKQENSLKTLCLECNVLLINQLKKQK
ncbi:3116_t:CDS:2, partial [Scutellospora calospora]